LYSKNPPAIRPLVSGSGFDTCVDLARDLLAPGPETFLKSEGTPKNAQHLVTNIRGTDN
jgi:hypothetical protein